VSVKQNMMELKGTKLHEPQIETEGRPTRFKDFTDRKVKHTQPLICKDQEWAFCYQERDTDLVNEIIKALN